MEVTRLKSCSSSIRSAYTLFSTSLDQLGAHSSLATALSYLAPALSAIVALPVETVLNNIDVRTSLRDALSVASVAISAPGSLSPLLRSDPDVAAVRTANAYKTAIEEVFMVVVSKCLGSGHAMAIFRVLQLTRASDGAADASGLVHLEKILYSSFRILKPLQPTLLIALTDAALSLGSTSFADAFRISAGPQFVQDSSSMLGSLQKSLEGLISQSLFEMTLVKDFPKGFNPQPDTVLSATGGTSDVGILHSEGFDVSGSTYSIALNVTSLLRLHDAALNRGPQCSVLSSTTLQNVWVCLPHAMPTAICERQYNSEEIGQVLTQALYSSWLEDASDLLSTSSTSTLTHHKSNGLKDGRLSSSSVAHRRHYVPVAYAALTRLVSQIVSACDGLCPQAPTVPLSNFTVDAALFAHVLSGTFPIPSITNPAWTDALFVYPATGQAATPLSKLLIKAVTMSRFFFRVAAKTLAPLASLSLQSGAKAHPAVKETLASVIHLVRGVFYLTFAPVNRIASPLQEECRRGETALSELAWTVLKPLLLTVHVNSGRGIGEGSVMDPDACSELSWELLLQMLTESVNVKRHSHSHQSLGCLLLSLRIICDMYTTLDTRQPNTSFSRYTEEGLLALISLLPALFEASASEIRMNNDLHSAYHRSSVTSSSSSSSTSTFLTDIPNHIVESLRPFLTFVMGTDTTTHASVERGDQQMFRFSSLEAERSSKSAMFAILLRFSLSDSVQQRDIGHRLWSILVINPSPSQHRSSTSSLKTSSSAIVSTALRILIDAGYSAGDILHRSRAGDTLSRLVQYLDHDTILQGVIAVILPPITSSSSSSSSSSNSVDVKPIISASAIDLFSSDNRLSFLTSFFEALNPSHESTRLFTGHASFLFNAALNVVANSATACSIDAAHRRLYQKLLIEAAALAGSCARICAHSYSQEEADAALSTFFQVVQRSDLKGGADVEDDLCLLTSFLRLQVRCINRERTDLLVILNTALSMCTAKGISSLDVLEEGMDRLSEVIIVFFKIMLDRPKNEREPVRIAIFNCLNVLVDRDLTLSSTSLSLPSSVTAADHQHLRGLTTTASCLSEVALRLSSKAAVGGGGGGGGGGLLGTSESERTIKLRENIERASVEILQSSGLDVKKWTEAKEVALKMALETR